MKDFPKSPLEKSENNAKSVLLKYEESSADTKISISAPVSEQFPITETSLTACKSTADERAVAEFETVWDEKADELFALREPMLTARFPWSEAITTGTEADFAACPNEGAFPFKAVT